jgi:hypothetical protein
MDSGRPFAMPRLSFACPDEILKGNNDLDSTFESRREREPSPAVGGWPLPACGSWMS